jgi:hypothetical protein
VISDGPLSAPPNRFGLRRRFVWPVAECLEASRPVKAPGDITLATSFPFCRVPVMKTLMKSTGFAVFPAIFSLFIFVTHCANEVELPVMLVPYEKTIGLSILCITYITARKICGKMAGMKIGTSRCRFCQHYRTGMAHR